MTGSAMLPLLEAVYAKLHGDSALLALATGGVYDAVPKGQAFPYVRIGSATEVPNSTFGKTGKAVTITISAFSQYPGNKEVLQIAERVHDLLDDASLTVAGYSCYDVSFEWSATLMESDGRTRHVPMRFRCLLEES